ncbi:hypothetical protein AO260_32155, partial [Pseudomonas sp. ABAC21]
MYTHHSLVTLARGGYAARGLLYLIIGIFALLAAQDATKPKDSHKSLEALLSQPFGYFLIGVVVAGLLAFAAWRVLQATRDVDHHGKAFKGLVIRAGLLAGGMVNGALAFFALGLLVSGIRSSGDSGGQTKDWLAHFLSWDHSNLLVYLIALVPFGVGVAHIIKGWKASFEKYMFLEISVLLAISGSAYQAMDPPGMKEALDALQNLPAGWLILIVMALGLIAFSVYSFSEAFWRRINMDLPG